MNTQNGTTLPAIPETYSVVTDERPVSPKRLQGQVNAIQEAMEQVMKLDTHFGKIPGTDKNTLYKPGAEKICLMFRLSPRVVEKVIRDLPGGHREIEFTMGLFDRTGALIGHGVGSCSTMESKYRYRGAELKHTDDIVGKEYWSLVKGENGPKVSPKEAIAKLFPGKYQGNVAVAKHPTTGAWVVAVKEGRQEHPDIADVWNTCLKMAKKRAFVDAVLTCTAASDIFTQDVKDDEESSFRDEDDDVPPPGPKLDTAEKNGPKVYYALSSLKESSPENYAKAEKFLKNAGAQFKEEMSVWESPIVFKNLSSYQVPNEEIEAWQKN